jgi:chromosome segregation ATPase
MATDISALKHTMESLQDILPTIPDKVQGVVTQGDEAKKDADELLHHFEDKQKAAEDLFGELKEALDTLKAESERLKQELDGETDAVGSGIDALKAVEEARDTLKQGVEQAGSVMEAFQQKLNEGIEAAHQAGDAFKAALDDVKTKTEESRQELDDALDSAGDAAEELQTKVEECKNGLSDTIDALSSQLAQAQSDAAAKIGEFLSAANTLRETFEGEVDEMVNEVIKDKANEIVDAMAEKISDELKKLVDDAVEEITDALKGMTDKVTEAKDGSGEARQLLEPLFDKVEAFMEPIKTVIDAVKDAAGIVGIDF